MALSTGSLASWSDIELLFKRASAERTRWIGSSSAISASSYGGQGQTIKASTPNSLKNLVQALGNVSYISSKVTTSSISNVSVGEQIKPIKLNSLNEILFNVKNTAGNCQFDSGFKNSFAKSSCSSFNTSFTFYPASNTTFYSFDFTASSNTNTVVSRYMSSHLTFFSGFNASFRFSSASNADYCSFGFNGTFFVCTSGFNTSFFFFGSRFCSSFSFCFSCSTYFSFGFNATFYSFSFNATFFFYGGSFHSDFFSPVNLTFNFNSGFNGNYPSTPFAVFFSTFNSFTFNGSFGFARDFCSSFNSFNSSFDFCSSFNNGFTFKSGFNSTFFTAGFCNNFQNYFS